VEIGIDSFAIKQEGSNSPEDSSRAMAELLERMTHADRVGVDSFGIGEHYREEFLDSAPVAILAAAAALTERIRLTSAVTVLSTADPVRVFQNFATLDLISQGRAEIVAGRGSSIESFPLFGYNLREYDQIFAEKLDLLLRIRENDVVNWSGTYRPALTEQAVYPRPLQDPVPIWLGVGGTPESFARAGTLGLPLMLAVIGGETHRFGPLVDLYRAAGEQAGHPPEQLRLGVHSLGYLADSTDQAVADFYPGYAKTFTKLAAERGFAPVTRAGFDTQNSARGAFMVGGPEEVAEKMLRHSEALGGVSRFTLNMDVANLSHHQLMHSIELLGSEVPPLLNDASSTTNTNQDTQTSQPGANHE
jgi:probable LLM family oxidoreductase